MIGTKITTDIGRFFLFSTWTWLPSRSKTYTYETIDGKKLLTRVNYLTGQTIMYIEIYEYDVDGDLINQTFSEA